MGSKKDSSKKNVSKKAPAKSVSPKKSTSPDLPSVKGTADEGRAQQILREGLLGNSSQAAGKKKLADIEPMALQMGMTKPEERQPLAAAVNKINPAASVPIKDMPEDIRGSLKNIRASSKRFHGIKLNLGYFPFPWITSPCADKFGYLSPALVRATSKLPFTPAVQALLGELGGLMGDPNRDTGADSVIPAGYTYFGQFVDHDITMDVSSTIEEPTDANTINNMRSPSLDLDSVYGRGPGLDPFLYVFPTGGPDTAIKLVLGTNTATGPGGPGGAGGAGTMRAQTNFDVPRIHNPLNATASTHTAIIGDPRNDENLIVSQFHHTMLKFHNQVVDLLVLAGFNGDIFVEAKKRVIHHYQWAVINDYLKRICGSAAVSSAAIARVSAPINSPFRMPVEFSVAAYRMGHSMIRNQYWINFNFPNASLAQVFEFIRNPRLPVFSNWVVDFNAFFDTGVSVPINNKARKIDSVLASGLESIPGGSGIMAILATRNLRRALAFGLPSGQAMAKFLELTPMTTAQLTQGLLPDEIAFLNANSGLLLKKTPLWYYTLREASVLAGGNTLGPVGAKIVAETFIRILKRDDSSYLNARGGFTPTLPSASPGTFTVADLIKFAGVNQP